MVSGKNQNRPILGLMRLALGDLGQLIYQLEE